MESEKGKKSEGTFHFRKPFSFPSVQSSCIPRNYTLGCHVQDIMNTNRETGLSADLEAP